MPSLRVAGSPGLLADNGLPLKKVQHMRHLQFTAHIERDPETGLYIGMVPSIPGAHTQAKGLDELQANLKEVLELCLEEMNAADIKALPEFVGLQTLSVAV